MKVKVVSGLIGLMLCTKVFSGINGPTYHSRANCVNNESISWDLTSPHMFFTQSEHFSKTKSGDEIYHKVTTKGMESTWRSAAVHWFEGAGGGWDVYGWHSSLDEDGKEIILCQTRATDCNIYDGWWDFEQLAYF